MILAHLSDLHLDGSAVRRQRFAEGLGWARRAGATHLLLTGDLTAYGHETECHELAGILDAYWPKEAGLGRTVVPGNHDGWGPIDRILPKARTEDLGEAVVVPLDTRYHRRALVFRASGAVSEAGLGLVRHVATHCPDRPIVVAMHHSPERRWPFEALVGRSGMGALLEQLPQVHVACGHDHERRDVGRVHIAASIAHDPGALRLYEASGGRFRVIA